MNRPIQIGIWLLLVAASGFAAQKGGNKPPKAAPPLPSSRNVLAKPDNPRPDQPKSGGAGNPTARPGGPRLPNPLGNPVLRMMGMPPEQRERILEKLPLQRQAQLRQSFDEFDKLPAPEKARRLQLLQTFSSLPPEKQQILARQLPAFNQLPQERRQAMLKELVQLWRMPESERQTRLNSEGYKSQFSPTELQMLSDIAQNYPYPGK